MNRFFLLLLCITFTLQGVAQNSAEDRYYFHVNIANSASLTIEQHPDGGRLNIQNRKDPLETEIYENFKVFTFEKAFPSTRNKMLQSVFSIATNDVGLLSQLKHNFPEKYTRIDQFYPNENSYYPNDYGETSPNENLGVALKLHDLDLIDAPGAWGITKGSKKVVIGISDGKVDSTSADIKGRVSTYLKYFNNTKGNVCVHGTNVAAIAAGNMDDAHGRPGLCSGCDVITNGYGMFKYVEELVAAGAKVINTSWVTCGMGTYHENIEARINEWYDDGIIIVASAGNGKDCNKEDDYGSDDYGYPASFEKVISVTGVYAANENPSDSTFIGKEGKKATTHLKDRHIRELAIDDNGKLYAKYWRWAMQFNESVDICAPIETYLAGDAVCGEKKPTSYGGATSTAAPYITGVIGLMWSANYCLSAYEIESILKLTSAPIDHLEGNERFVGKLGSGRVNAHEAVKMARDLTLPDGTVLISERDFSRFHFELKQAPNNIRIQNQTFRDSATVAFTGKRAIQLKPGTHLKPDRSGYVSLQIDPDISYKECFPTPVKKYTSVYPERKLLPSTINKDIQKENRFSKKSKVAATRKSFKVSLDHAMKAILVSPLRKIEASYTVTIYTKDNTLYFTQEFGPERIATIPHQSFQETSVVLKIVSGDISETHTLNIPR